MNLIKETPASMSQDYINKLNLYYSQILSSTITSDGKYLLALIKTGYLAVFALKNHLERICQLYDSYEESSSSVDLLKPLAHLPVKSSLCLADVSLGEDKRKFILAGKGSLYFFPAEKY